MADTETTTITETVLAADEYPLKSIARASFRKFITFTSIDVIPPNSLTGLFEIKTHRDAALPLFVGTHLNGIIKFTAEKSFTLEIPPIYTKDFKFDEAYYHLFVTNTSINFTRRLLHGPFYCEQT